MRRVGLPAGRRGGGGPDYPPTLNWREVPITLPCAFNACTVNVLSDWLTGIAVSNPVLLAVATVCPPVPASTFHEVTSVAPFQLA